MGVTYTNFVNPPGGVPLINKFSDNFLRSGALAGTVGPDWVMTTGRNAGGNDSYAAIQVSPNGQFNWSHAGGSNSSCANCILVPRALMYATTGSIWGISQFVQATFKSSAQGCASGIGVLSQWNSDAGSSPQQAYVYANLAGGNNRIQWVQGTTNTSLLAGQAELAANDVIRIECLVQGAGNNNLKFFKNGTLLGTFNDTNLQQVGFPCLYVESMNSAGGMNWTNFSCGAL